MAIRFQIPFGLLLCQLLVPLPAQEASNETPAISAPAPRLQVAAEDVLSTHTVRSGERDVTFCKIRPLSLPPIPEPAPRVELTEAQIEEFRQSIPEKYRTRKHLFVGASAYVVKDENGNEEYYSHVRYWPDYQGETVEFWTNANFVWLSGQMAEFEIGEQWYSLMLASSVVDVSAMELLAQQQDPDAVWKINIPDFPEFEEAAPSSIQITKGNPSEEALAPVRALLSYYDANKLRLKTSFEQRRADAEVRRLQRLADPPEKKNLIIRHWRLDQPAEKAAIIR